MIKKVVLFIVITAMSFSLHSQNIKFVRGLIDTLSSADFFGRGYVNNGDKKTADFIISQIKKLNLKAFNNSYEQKFPLSINILDGNAELTINNKSLVPGEQFVIMPNTYPVSKTFKTIKVDVAFKNNKKKWDKFLNSDISDKLLIIDTGISSQKIKKLYEAAVLLYLTDKPVWWHVSGGYYQDKPSLVHVLRTAIEGRIKNVNINVDARLDKKYQTQNVIGYIEGKVCKDSFLVFTAHYDHLGMMGNKTFFPGANDNASGTAMLLDLASYYSQSDKQPQYSMAFIFFSAEEVGLLGSEFYTDNPLFPLSNIKFLINLDMVGTGSEGIKVVNGSIYKTEFNRLKAINDSSALLKSVQERGEAPNSDHYHFHKKGIRSFFIYTLGKEHLEYHTTGDKSSILPLTKYNELFKLVVSFTDGFNKAE